MAGRAEFPISAGADAVMDHHHVVRDGSSWLCVHCKRTWPYPAPVPVRVAEDRCTPRRWGDG